MTGLDETRGDVMTSRERADRGDRPFTVGIWGTSDLDNYGDLLFPTIIGREIQRRLPRSIVRSFGPLGSSIRVTFEDAEAAEPLGRWSSERRAELADELDAVIVGGGDLIHERDEDYATWYGLERELTPSWFFVDGLGSEHEARCPVIWNSVGIPFDLRGEFAERVRKALSRRSYGSVRDRSSRRRLEAIDAPELDIVPDPAFLLPRMLGERRLARRLRYLRARGWFPLNGSAVVVQAHSGYVGSVDELAVAIGRILEASPGLEVVLVETGPCHGDGAFADALQPRLPIRPHRLPPSSGLSATAAAIAGSAGFIGSSLHGSITAFAYGRPAVTLTALDSGKLKGFAETIGREDLAVTGPDQIPDAYERARRLPSDGEALGRIHAELDAHFDRVASLIRNTAAARSRPPSRASRALGLSLQGSRERLAASTGASERGTDSMAETILELRREIERLEAALGSVTERLVGAERATAEAEGRVSALGGEVESGRRTVAGLEARLHELSGSTRYRLGNGIVRAVGRLAPPGTRRRRWARRLARRILRGSDAVEPKTGGPPE